MRSGDSSRGGHTDPGLDRNPAAKPQENGKASCMPAVALGPQPGWEKRITVLLTGSRSGAVLPVTEETYRIVVSPPDVEGSILELSSVIVASFNSSYVFFKVLDACSAPGNKAVQMAALMRGTGRIVACELNKERVKLLEETVYGLMRKEVGI
ncbi:hypothetical protein EJ110_NYTH11373 [Nymphaea thermarum]|nr:hypothetical protein EJ110_NYTH11373 [Nymphaea thermarum]